MQDRESLSINRSDTSMVADNPDCKIDLKAFCSEIVNDHAELKKEVDACVLLHEVWKINNAIVERNYL